MTADGLKPLHVTKVLGCGGNHLACAQDAVHVVAAQPDALALVRVEVCRRLKPGQDDEVLAVELAREVRVEVVLGEAEKRVAMLPEGGYGLLGSEATVGVGGVAVQVALEAGKCLRKAYAVAKRHDAP